MSQKTDKIGWRTSFEPIVVNPHFIERAKHAERIIHSPQPAAEMIAIELPLKFCFHIVLAQLIFQCHLLDLLLKDSMKFFLGNT